jgi:GH24 family phage-related lysozyme (muramidase)
MGAVRDTVLDAADALYAFEKSKTGNSDFDPALYQQSIERVTGGMLNSGDNKVMAPVPGMTQGRLNDLVETLSPKAMLEFSVTGGAPVFADGTPFDPQLLDKPFLSSGTDAQLFSMGIGKYGIINPGSGPVLDSNGDLYQLDLRAFNESGQPDTAIEARQTRGEQQEEKTGIKALRERGQAVVQQEDFALEQGGPDDSELDDSAPEVKDLSRPKTKDSDIGTDEAWGAGEKKFSLVSSAEAADQPLRKSDSAADRGSFGTEFKQIRDDEGVDVSVRDEKVVRHDGTTKIVPTAGWGHKLTKDEQAAIKSGEITLDEDQFEKWWRDDLQTALNGARSVVNQDDVSNDVFNILVNMHFNLGRAGVKKFKGMIKAIKAKNYKLAARHMEFSKPNAKKKTKTPWLLQTGNRAQRLIDRMKKIK